MGRTRRQIQVGKPYELILRVKEGLPFRPGPLINAIIKSAMARTQRDNKVTLCHYLWMGNHVHILLIPKCPQSCVNFYQELQKKITDAFKRLLGRRRLNLWEGDPVLAQILDIEKAIDRIAYLYANPSRANIVDSINEYRGVSSWEQFISETTHTEHPWFRLPKIRKLSSLYISTRDEDTYHQQTVHQLSNIHELKLEPHAIFKALETKEDMKNKVLRRILAMEELARATRKREGKTLPSQKTLAKQKIFARHTPMRKPREKRVFVLSSIKQLRISFIEAYKKFCDLCSHCYKLSLIGISEVPWPKAAFRPYSLVT